MPAPRNAGIDPADPLTRRFLDEFSSAIPASIYPIYLEPMFGSGERWTLVLAIIGPDSHRVLNTVPDSLYRCLGSLGDGLYQAAGEIAGNLKQWLANGKAIGDWTPPFQSCEIGQPMEADLDDMEQGVSIGISTFASLMAKSINEPDLPVPESLGMNRSRWAGQVRAAVLEQKAAMAPLFNRSAQVRYKEADVEYLFGFVGRTLAANFASITPHNLAYSRGGAESELMHLEQLRSHQKSGELLTLQHFELFAYAPATDELTNEEQRRLRGALDGLDAYAYAHQLRLHVDRDATAAARRILQLENA